MTPRPLEQGFPEPWASEWGEDRFGLFMSFAVGGVQQRMRWIPPGSFEMGSPIGELGRSSDETQHSVQLTSGFWLAETACAQALWDAVMGNDPSESEGSRPVERISWEECQQFCERLNKLVPGLGATLPTEAQWEYACRAGTPTATWAGDLDDGRVARVLDAIAWYRWNNNSEEPQGPQNVRQKQPNPWGLYDMLGNVDEWCADWYANYTRGAVVDPRGPRLGSRRVLRGGSWIGNAWSVRAACRSKSHPVTVSASIGFRLVRGPRAGAEWVRAEPPATRARR